MTFKPMTYLVSFTLFVLLFMGLGGYAAYAKMADHFLALSFLEAASINVHLLGDRQGTVLRWEDKVPLEGGGIASILASNRPGPISILYSDQPRLTVRPSPEADGIPLVANECAEDVRIDKAGRYLYARVFAGSRVKSEETTWLCQYDLNKRKLVRRTCVNPALLPVPFRP
jgi:hypothetical protein